MRLPTIVMRSRAGTGVASRRSGRSISKAMPRSLACAALPSSSASSTGSSTAESSRSARAWLRASSELASAAASAGRSSSMRAMIVCSRFANSCACERSASESVRHRLELAGELLQLGVVAQRRDRADAAGAATALARHDHVAVDHEHVRRGDRDLVDGGVRAAEHVGDGGRQVEPRERHRRGVVRRAPRQAEELGGTVVVEHHGIRAVLQHEALADRVQHALVVREHAAHLLGTATPRDAPQVPAEQPCDHGADGDHRERGEQHRRDASAERDLGVRHGDPGRDERDHVAVVAEHGHHRPHRGAERARVRLGERVARERAVDVAEELLADLRRDPGACSGCGRAP